MIEIGQIWMCKDDSHISVWKVVFHPGDGARLKTEPSWDQDVFLESMLDTTPSNSPYGPSKPGDIYPYRSSIMEHGEGVGCDWQQIEEQDIPLVILGDL